MWKASDAIGKIELLHKMGDDLMVVNAARVSFHKESKFMTSGDAKLIKYLADHEHTSPFFHPQIQFRIKMPIFVAREWYRHQIGFSRNEVSRRYVDSEPEYWTPAPHEIRERDPKLKQGSKENPVENAEDVYGMMEDHCRATVHLYNSLLAKGVAPEVARAILPQSMYTEFIETGSLAAYARLYKLRTSPDAQREIQGYARAIGDLLAKEFPISWAALTSSGDAA
jgi:thymidylate synthase (FAD)